MNKSIAVTFTIDNSTYTDLWTKYYEQFVDELKIINVNESLKHDWGATSKNLNEVQAELFKDFGLIVFVDMDEILVPDPEKYTNLRDYLDKVDGTKRCTGYHVMEMPGEGVLDMSRQITSQRTKWLHDPMYDKTVIITKPTVYLNNHHSEGEPQPDSDLVMFHLRDADIASARGRAESLGRTFDMNELEYRRSRVVDIPEKWRVI